MNEKAVVGKTVLKRHEVARPVHMQRLEAALDVVPFVSQVERILNSDDDSDSEDDPEFRYITSEMSKGDRLVHGVVTTKQERQSDRLRLYNLASVGEEREWIRDVLLSSGPDTSSDDEETPEGKELRLQRILKERRFQNKYARKYYKDPGNSRYMYYGAGIMSTIDRYPERRMSRSVPPPPATRGRRGRPSERGSTRGMAKSRRGRARETRPCTDVGDNMPDGVDWEDQLRNIKQETDAEEYNVPIDKPGVRGRKKLSTLKSPEALTARRRRHWLLLVKKELGKVQRARTATHREVLLQRKRLATLCCKHWRHVAMQSQKNMKETVWRCKRLSREMQAYWRRYDRAERETRRRMEKEAEEQRKMDVELMEAKRQRRKLNFLITQTELYAHFMQRKLSSAEDGDSGADRILRQLDEDRDPRLAGIDHYDSDAMKARASRNAREAFHAERARTQLFDAAAGAGEPERAPGDHDQPAIFRGTLKGYQLKGMNWLANLYDQGISGILADEMGLGKTVQCIAFLCHVAERLGVWGPFLVVSPASTLHNWQQEMERFVPDFKVVPYWGSPSERKILRQFWERKDLHTRQAAFHVVVTSYQIVVSDLKYLNRVSWQYMILDEAQAIKSSASMRWKLLLGFSCRNRLLLSGTPIQNSMAELWALLHFIMPTLFDSHEEFNEWFSKDIESHAENKSTIDEKHLSRLHMILKPFMLRRIKKDVENELSDKIEIMVHCPLTIRQKLLYIALKKKIKIEELLHYSVGAESGHNVDKNFTSNLMNLVMQFRKVCNHPELFERRDVKSPFAMHIDDYHIPKLVAEDGVLIRSIPSKRHLLYNILSVLIPEHVHRNANDCELEESQDGNVKCFAFTRFMDLSPMEIYRVMLCGWLYAMQHIEYSLEKYERIRHRQNWWDRSKPSEHIKVEETEIDDMPNYYDQVRCKDSLLICPDGDVLGKRKEDSLLWKEMLFTDPLWVPGGPFYTHTDHTIHYMPETIEHRAMRLRCNAEKEGQPEMLSEIKTEEGGVISVQTEEQPFPHIERPPVVYRDMPTPLPSFLYTAQQKVSAHTRVPFAVSRSFAYHVTRHQHAECREGCEAADRLVAAARPPAGWASLQVPVSRRPPARRLGVYKCRVSNASLSRQMSASHSQCPAARPLPAGRLYKCRVSAHTRVPFAVSRSFAYHVTRHQHAECREGCEAADRLVAAARPPTGWASLQVSVHTRVPFAVSRSFAYHVTRHQHAECREGCEAADRLVAAARPPAGWASLQVPDKNQLVSDAGKLTVLDSLLKRLKERGHRVLIYSQMTKMIDLLEEYMWHRKHKYMRLDGSSKISARRDMVADFQARADIFVFLLSTRAGGLGINLTAADTVIFYDSDWNPTVDQQAMDRAHRLGQTKQVTVYRLICKGTIEERIMQRAREKSEIQRMVISGGNFKPDTLKPKEVVSLLLDDEEIELKYRQKSEEKKIMEERERKRKLGILPPQPAVIEPKRTRDSASEPGSPLQVDDDGDQLVVDAPPLPAVPMTYSPPVRSSAWGVSRASRSARRGRPRGSRHALQRRPDPKPQPADTAIAIAAGAALLESDAPLETIEAGGAPRGELRGRRGPGRPRLRASAPRAAPRRPRRPREPLLVPLAPPP
ncbi:chromatin-remodeling ATPase INO80 [Ostrinia furnacalis]|uniref:chromatin-remodeling ATPase INO80 n=1 Tax=Ostrinia furnacalis TaxID=93504 RepID=UPI00103B9623|nr:chromatin-remodeling ATPase INO80 [Ostrinia furnacalis]